MSALMANVMIYCKIWAALATNGNQRRPNITTSGNVMNTVISRKNAIAAGLNKYYTGFACRNGHVAERYTVSGTCITCLYESNSHRVNVHTMPAEELQRRANRATALNELPEVKLRARAQDWPTLRDTAAALCVGRYPELTLADVTSNHPGIQPIDQVYLYRALVPAVDIQLMRDTENALRSLTPVDTSAIRARQQAIIETLIEVPPSWTETP